jgi:hypothetical protein
MRYQTRKGTRGCHSPPRRLRVRSPHKVVDKVAGDYNGEVRSATLT